MRSYLVSKPLFSKVDVRRLIGNASASILLLLEVQLLTANSSLVVSRINMVDRHSV